MTSWQRLRLELARTAQFPEGSPDRGYVIRVPLDDDNLIDADALQTHQEVATVRRFWPGETGMGGFVVATPRGWGFSYRPGEEDDEIIHQLESHRLGLGDYITLTEPDGDQAPFKVVSVMNVDPQPS